MKLLFKSITDDEVISEVLSYKLENNELIFTYDDTTYSFLDVDEGLICHRRGKIEQTLKFYVNKITQTNLNVEYNISLSLYIYTDIVKKTENGYYIKYRLFADKEMISVHKIWIKYLANTSKIDYNS